MKEFHNLIKQHLVKKVKKKEKSFQLLEISSRKLLKVGLPPSKRNCLICYNERPLRVTKNAFTIHILHNISRSKDNQTIKFGQVIEYNKRNILFKNHVQNETRMLIRKLFLFFKRAFYEERAGGLQLSFNIFWQSSTWHTIKTSCIQFQTTDPDICSILIFQKRVWEQYLYCILCMTIQKNVSIIFC